jgi:hypothetical protein
MPFELLTPVSTGDCQRLAAAIARVLEKAAAEEQERLVTEQRQHEEKERLAAEQQEKERLEAERREKERIEAEQREREEQERLAAEQRQCEEKGRFEAEQREKQGFEAERLEKEGLQDEQPEKLQESHRKTEEEPILNFKGIANVIETLSSKPRELIGATTPFLKIIKDLFDAAQRIQLVKIASVILLLAVTIIVLLWLPECARRPGY